MWPLLAIGAALLWALSNIIDRLLIRKARVGWEELVGVATFSLFSTSLLFGLLLGGEVESALIAPAFITVGLIWLLTLFYYKALSSAKVEEAAPLLALSAIFALAIDIATGHPLTTQQKVGVLLAFLGAFLMAWKGKLEGVGFALLAALAIALRNSIGAIFNVELASFITTYSLLGLIMALPLLFLGRREPREALPFAIPNVLNGLAFALLVLSLQGGSAALSTALAQLSSIFVVTLGWIAFKAKPERWGTLLMGAALLTLGAVLCIL